MLFLCIKRDGAIEKVGGFLDSSISSSILLDIGRAACSSLETSSEVLLKSGVNWNVTSLVTPSSLLPMPLVSIMLLSREEESAED